MKEYHVALSFAGEDRDYVEQVASHLQDKGLDVFYDKFEEAILWGKDLYSYLSDIYQNRAHYAVIFISEAYKDKWWTNHERRSAQARALIEREEYILPAYFDKDIEVPGLLKSIGFIDLADLEPEEFASIIVEKLESSGVLASTESMLKYSDTALADIDFPMSGDDEITHIIAELRSLDWYKQNPAIKRLPKLDWDKIDIDQLFVLGRNIYQSACGESVEALKIINNLRRAMAEFPLDVAEHLMNGMFYEVYFNSKGEFRGDDLKGDCISSLYALQDVKRYQNCILYIRNALHPFRTYLPVLPNNPPETAILEVNLNEQDPTLIEGIKVLGKECRIDLIRLNGKLDGRLWRLQHQEFDLNSLVETVRIVLNIPENQLVPNTDRKISSSTELKFSE